MLTRADIWAGLITPGALTAGLLVVGWRLARRRWSMRQSRSWAGPLAVGAGYAAGYLALFGWPGVPPIDSIDWLCLLAVPLTLAGLLDSCLRIGWPGRVLLIAVVVPWALLLPAWPLFVAEAQAGAPVALQLAVAVVLACAAVMSLDALGAHLSAARLSGILLAVSVPAALVLALSGSLRLGQIGGLLAAAAAGALAVNLILGTAAVGRGMVPVFGPLLAGLLWCGHLFSELTTADALLLAAAPNMAWLAQRLPRRFGRLSQALAQLLLVMATAGIALVGAWLRFSREAL